MRIKTLFVLLFLSVSITFSQSSSSPYQFLELASSARSAGLGGTFVCFQNDASGVFFNPALINTVEDKRFSATFLKHVLDINSGNLVYIDNHKIISNGTLAFSINYTNFGTFENYDSKGMSLNKSSTSNNIAFAVSYGNKLDTNFYYGVTAKFISVTLDEASSVGLAIDAGMFYKLKDGRTNLGVSILNLGTQLSTLGDAKEKLPTDLRIGINHRLRGLPLLVNFSFNNLADATSSIGDKFKSFSVGGELYLGKSSPIMARLGYNNIVRSSATTEYNKGFSGLSAGIGLKTTDYSIDYGFSEYGSVVSLHRFTISMNLD